MKFNGVFDTLNNQIELRRLAKERIHEARIASARARTEINRTKDRRAARKLEERINSAENYAKRWQPFVHVLPDIDLGE